MSAGKMTYSASDLYVTLYCNYAWKTTYIDRVLELRNYLLRILCKKSKARQGDMQKEVILRTKQNGCVRNKMAAY